MFDADFTQKSVESEIGNTEEPVMDDNNDANFSNFSYIEEDSIIERRESLQKLNVPVLN